MSSGKPRYFSPTVEQAASEAAFPQTAHARPSPTARLPAADTRIVAAKRHTGRAHSDSGYSSKTDATRASASKPPHKPYTTSSRPDFPQYAGSATRGKTKAPTVKVATGLATGALVKAAPAMAYNYQAMPPPAGGQFPPQFVQVQPTYTVVQSPTQPQYLYPVQQPQPSQPQYLALSPYSPPPQPQSPYLVSAPHAPLSPVSPGAQMVLASQHQPHVQYIPVPATGPSVPQNAASLPNLPRHLPGIQFYRRNIWKGSKKHAVETNIYLEPISGDKSTWHGMDFVGREYYYEPNGPSWRLMSRAKPEVVVRSRSVLKRAPELDQHRAVSGAVESRRPSATADGEPHEGALSRTVGQTVSKSSVARKETSYLPGSPQDDDADEDQMLDHKLSEAEQYQDSVSQSAKRHGKSSRRAVDKTEADGPSSYDQHSPQSPRGSRESGYGSTPGEVIVRNTGNGSCAVIYEDVEVTARDGATIKVSTRNRGGAGTMSSDERRVRSERRASMSTSASRKHERNRSDDSAPGRDGR